MCKHKDVVSKHFGIANFTTMPTYDTKAPKEYLFIAAGTYFDDSTSYVLFSQNTNNNDDETNEHEEYDDNNDDNDGDN